MYTREQVTFDYWADSIIKHVHFATAEVIYNDMFRLKNMGQIDHPNDFIDMINIKQRGRPFIVVLTG